MENATPLASEKKEKKIRVLALCDSPTSATGFAQVSKNVLNGLYKTGKYHIDVIGINFHGDAYDRNQFPYNIYPAMPQGWADMYGRARLIQALSANQVDSGLIPPWDIVFTIQDPFIIEGLGINLPFGEQLKVSSEMWKRMTPPEVWFKWIGYFPVDSDLKDNWVRKAIAVCEYPVAYCDWGKAKMMQHDKPEFSLNFNLAQQQGSSKVPARFKVSSMKDRLTVINHGVDVTKFKPISEKEKQEFRKDYFKGTITDDTFLVVNVSRNQPRKDLARTMKAFALFKRKVSNAFLYLHCKDQDAGGSIEEIAHNFGLEIGTDYSVPESFHPGIGFPVETINKIYNIADVCVTTTLGEGWGFITTESMATMTPIVAPNITSIYDIFNSYDYDGSLEQLDTDDKLRGVPVKAGSNSSEWVCLGLEDNERVRPLTNVDDLVEKLYWVYTHKDSKVLANMKERAFQYVQSLHWDNIVKQWDNLFMTAYSSLEKERATGRAIDNAGRNDPCPCDSGKKFKVCHGDPTFNDRMRRFDDWVVKDSNQNKGV